MNTAQRSCRAAAAKVLAPVFRAEKSLQYTFDAAIENVNDNDKAFFHTLCFGCLREFEWIEAAAQEHLNKPLKSKDADINALIFIGIYQLRFLRTPDHAAISETVAATKQLKKPWAKNLVNAVLRGFQREKEAIDNRLADHPSANARCPAWLLGKLKKQWPDSWHAIVAANTKQAPLTVRVNAQRRERQNALSELITAGIGAHECTHSEVGLTLTSVSDIAKLEGIQEGWLSVQDEAAQLATVVLAPKAQDRILDACAAPGGKTCHLLECQPNIACLQSLDNHAQRSQRIQQNLQRLGLHATLIHSEAQDVTKWWDGIAFDRILLDAPCSATGVIRRHPDIKRLRHPDDIAKLAAIQLEMLNALWATLAVQGTLVYATCSILKTENECIIEQFLSTQKDAVHDPIEADWGIERPFGRQLFPVDGGHDGFYYARLHKRSALTDH